MTLQKNLGEYMDRYRNAQPDVQDIMTSMDTAHQIQSIGKKYQLTEEKTREMSYQIGLVLLKMEDFTNLYMKLKEKLTVSEDVAITIANDINKQILYKATSKPAQTRNEQQPTGEANSQRKRREPVQKIQDKNKIARIKKDLEQNKTERLVDILKDVE